MITAIKEQDETNQVQMWSLVNEFGLIDARRTLVRVEARLEVIDKLAELIEGGAKEVPDIHNYLLKHPWLLDPRWELYDDEFDLKAHLIKEFGIKLEDTKGKFADYIFCLGPKAPTSADEVIVVEIKRGKDADGTDRKATQDEVNIFHNYVISAGKYYASSSELYRPRVRGLMIATGYTGGADTLRATFEQVPEAKFRFKNWKAVLSETRRLHAGWYEVVGRRAIPDEGNRT